MIAYDRTRPGLVEITVEGEVTTDDITEACARMEQDIASAGTLKVLEDVTGFEGIGPAAVWQDLTHALPLAKSISHVAIVTESGWIRAMTGMSRIFTTAEIRTFPPAEIDEARAWLEAA